MPSRDPIASAPGDSLGSRLEQLVFQALERHAQGGAAALEAFVAAHPQDAAALRAELGQHVPPLLGKPQDPKLVDESVNVLSVKVMADGDLDVYAQPLLDSKT